MPDLPVTTSGPVTIAAGEARIFDVRRAVRITVISGTGATATVSRVDSPGASAHTTGTENQFTVAATTKTATDVDWPFYRVSAAGGSVRVAVV
jgi:hypothetical protein